MVALDARGQDVADERASIQDVQARITAANAAGPALATAAVSYRDQLGTGLATVDQLLGTARQMATIRAQQVDAAQPATTRRSTRCRSSTPASPPRGTAGGSPTSHCCRRCLPSPTKTPSTLPGHVPTPVALTPPAQTVLAPPTGPAQVNGSLPDVIPCVPVGTGCRWDWEITWTETNMLGAEIQSIGRRYIDRGGRIWVSEYGEWFDETISIAPGGTGHWSSFVRTTPEDAPNLDGGTMIVSWSGVDKEGNAFSGSAQARLQPRAEVG